jgi:hypothetical protein
MRAMIDEGPPPAFANPDAASGAIERLATRRESLMAIPPKPGG